MWNWVAAAIGIVNGATVFSGDEKRQLIQSMILLQLGLGELEGCVRRHLCG